MITKVRRLGANLEEFLSSFYKVCYDLRVFYAVCE